MIKLTMILISVLGLLSHLNGQDTISKKYYKDKDGGPTVEAKKGKFVEVAISNPDKSIVYILKRLKDDKLFRIKQYTDGIPSGKWIDYDDNGKIIEEFDYDFDLVYNDNDYPDVLHFDIKANSLKESINGEFKAPVFLDGTVDIRSYVTKRFIYPIEAAENGIAGKVITQCIIDENGNLTDFSIMKSAHKLLDKETLRVIRKTPQWKPAMLNGKPIKVCIQITSVFMLQQ